MMSQNLVRKSPFPSLSFGGLVAWWERVVALSLDRLFFMPTKWDCKSACKGFECWVFWPEIVSAECPKQWTWASLVLLQFRWKCCWAPGTALWIVWEHGTFGQTWLHDGGLLVEQAEALNSGACEPGMTRVNSRNCPNSLSLGVGVKR